LSVIVKESYMRNFVRNTLIAGGTLAAVLTTGAAAHADVVHPVVAPVVAPNVVPVVAPNAAPFVAPDTHPVNIGR
jgi:hypothetical protein